MQYLTRRKSLIYIFIIGSIVRIIKKISCFIIILLLTFLPCFTQEKNLDQDINQDHTFDSLKKSLLIPGWGQFAEKRYIEGVFFLSSEIFSLYKIFSTDHKANKFYRQYKEADNTEDAIKFRELTEKYDKDRNIFILAAVGIWAVNLVDIYVIVKKKEKKKLEVKLESGRDKKLVFTISYHF
jgi:hypothetical protein